MKILVTGGAGFIGSHVVRNLLNAGAQVVVLDNMSTGKRENLPHSPQLHVREGDVANMDDVTAVMAGVDHIVHLAAVASVPYSLENPAAAFSSNVVGTENVLAAARQAHVKGWVLYASSAAVYGPLDQPRVVEKDALGAVLKSPYAVSKRTNELQAAGYAEYYGLRTLGLRFFNVYGAGVDVSNPYSGVLAKVLDSIDTGSLFTIFGDGLQTRDFIYVGDVAMAIRQLLMRPLDAPTPAVVNVGTGLAVTLLDSIRAMVALRQVNPKVEYRPARAGDIRHSCADNSLLRAVLPEWQPQPLTAGLKQWVL